MKKLAITIAIVLGMGMTSFAQEDYAGEKGLFGLNLGIFQDRAGDEEDPELNLPGQHGLDGDQEGPLGTGIVLLTSLGAATLLPRSARRRIDFPL